jgi:HEAT repeat protein
VKALCKLKSNTTIVARQLKSTDARVRANAIEALWHSGTAEVEAIFRSALLDEHHRVVINAVIGLHFLGDASACSKLLAYTTHPNEMYRLAAVWALGYLAHPEAILALQAVADSDISQSVRDKALNALTKFASSKVQSAAAA